MVSLVGSRNTTIRTVAINSKNRYLTKSSGMDCRAFRRMLPNWCSIVSCIGVSLRNEGSVELYETLAELGLFHITNADLGSLFDFQRKLKTTNVLKVTRNAQIEK